MEKNYDEFSIQEIKQLANSDLGKQLMRFMQNQHSETMHQVMDSAKRGDLEQAKQALSAFLSDPKAKAMLQQLQEAQNGRNGR